MPEAPKKQESTEAPRSKPNGLRSWWRRRSEAMRTTIVSGFIAIFVATGTLAAPPLFKALADALSPGVRLASVVVQEPDGEVLSMEFTIHNTGSSRGIVEEAIFTVEDVMTVLPCVGGGIVELSAEYDLLLPSNAEQGDQFTVPISQQVGPDEADRFAVNARLDEAFMGFETLFRLDVELVVDGPAEDVDAGTVIVALPYSPADSQLSYWGGEHTEFNLDYIEAQGEDGSGSMEECIDDNTQNLHDFLNAPGERPPSLERLFDELDLDVK